MHGQSLQEKPSDKEMRVLRFGGEAGGPRGYGWDRSGSCPGGSSSLAGKLRGSGHRGNPGRKRTVWVERSPEQEKMNRAPLIVGRRLSLQGEGGVRHKPAPKKAI